ncbi:prolyl-tRNA synthetase associated domain-containing protein [Microvirga sp. W0021]|uniref:Prolyl-tRNA synthetase associated domain-containing protein n=1 Tax=Hohaiivirga grylli TaxID=3133970 RepID=A0ABV0BGE4_9HYPH
MRGIVGAGDILAVSPQELFSYLETIGVHHETVEHPATFTVAESSDIKTDIPGAHSKNLFLKDKKGQLFLISAKDHTPINLKKTHEVIGGSGRLSFGSPEQMMHFLGVLPGSVTPFGVLNDKELKVKVILDSQLMQHERVNFHPLVNTMTTGLSRDGLLAFLRATGHEPEIMDLPAPPAE